MVTIRAIDPMIFTMEAPSPTKRLEELFSNLWDIGDLLSFHTREKLLVLSRDEVLYRKLGRLAGNSRNMNRRELEKEYRGMFLAAVSKSPNRKLHVNALEHALGFFKKRATKIERKKTLESIHSYRKGEVSLSTPMSLLHEMSIKYGEQYLLEQTYFSDNGISTD